MQANQNAAAQLQNAVHNFAVQNPQAGQVPVQQLVGAVRGRGRSRGGRGRGAGRGAPVGPPGWDMAKCQWGVPLNFGVNEAQQAVQNADFTQAVYVELSATTQATVKAFTYHMVGNVRICVVGDIHPQGQGVPAAPGNCYIPGFQNWKMRTPQNQVQVIEALQVGGAFPGDDRYPH